MESILDIEEQIVIEPKKEPKPKVVEPGKISGSQAVLEAFIAEGVETIFGYPAVLSCRFMIALYDYNDRLKHILVRHEQGSYSRRTRLCKNFRQGSVLSSLPVDQVLPTLLPV
jgi:acetolactate synthase-1/2/3 large subunit